MNCKQRVEVVLEGKVPDRSPIGFFAIDCDIAEKILGRPTYWRAKAKSQIAFWQGRRDEVVQSWIEDGIELYHKLDFIDIIPVCVSMAGICPPKDQHIDAPRQVDENTWEDKQGRIYRYSPKTKDITIVQDPTIWTTEYNVDEVIDNMKPKKPDETIFEVVDAFITEFSDNRFVLGPSAEELGWYLMGGYEKGFMELATRPDQIKELYLAMVDQACEMDKYFVRSRQSGVLWGTDYSDNNGTMISPDMFREIFLEGNIKRVRSVKSLGQYVLKHMCGNNWPILDMMAEIGIDCYQSVQASAGMDIVEVHTKYNDKFAVWGGVQVENLIGGDKKLVQNDVNRVMNKLSGAKKYIFGTSHSVAVGTKYENFMTMIDEFCKFNK